VGVKVVEFFIGSALVRPAVVEVPAKEGVTYRPKIGDLQQGLKKSQILPHQNKLECFENTIV
jgi:hypothetical protein